MKNKPAISLLVMTLAASAVVADASEMLRHNPFERPDQFGGQAGSAVNASGEMKLRGTVVDGHHSLVNIDGEYYRLQEEVSGYRVVQIESGSVTLRRGEIEMVLTLKDKDEK